MKGSGSERGGHLQDLHRTRKPTTNDVLYAPLRPPVRGRHPPLTSGLAVGLEVPLLHYVKYRLSPARSRRGGADAAVAGGFGGSGVVGTELGREGPGCRYGSRPMLRPLLRDTD